MTKKVNSNSFILATTLKLFNSSAIKNMLVVIFGSAPTKTTIINMYVDRDCRRCQLVLYENIALYFIFIIFLICV